MGLEYSFVVQKQDAGYRFVARQYGVAVWSQDAATGLKEFENRVAVAATQLSEAGFDLKEIEATPNGSKPSPRLWDQLLPFFVKAVVVASLFAAVLIPVANIFAKAIGPASPLLAALSHPAQFVVRLGDRAEGVPPQTISEVKLAIRKIYTKMAPIVSEVRAGMAMEQSIDPQPATKVGQPPAQ